MALNPNTPSNAIRFHSWREAYSWAFHVARTSGVKTRVKKIGERWYAWRQVGTLTTFGRQLAELERKQQG